MRARMFNFRYAAYSYLDEWMTKDRDFHHVLSKKPESDEELDKNRETLEKAASYYGVSRTLPRCDEPKRLGLACEALYAIDVSDVMDVVSTVENLAAVLETSYKRQPLSAASKFLWLRFRSPFVIYDSIAASALECSYSSHMQPT